LADLLAVIELLVQNISLRPELRSNGAVEFFDLENRLRGVVAFVTGRGARSGAAIQTAIVHYRKYMREGRMPTTYVVTGINGLLPETSVPEDIVTGESRDDLIGGPREFSLFMAEGLCRNRDLGQLIV